MVRVYEYSSSRGDEVITYEHSEAGASSVPRTYVADDRHGWDRNRDG
jgi:hypothetical protein